MVFIYENAKEGGRGEDGQTDLTTEQGPGSFMYCGISCFVLQHEQQIRGSGQTRTGLLDYSQAGKAGHRHVGVVGSQTHVKYTGRKYMKKLDSNGNLGGISLLSSFFF